MKKADCLASKVVMKAEIFFINTPYDFIQILGKDE